VTRTGSPRIAGYAFLAAVGLVGALALRRPELAVLAAPFAGVLALGLSLARDPRVDADLRLDAERTIEGHAVEATVSLRSPHSVDRLEILLDIPEEVEVEGGRSPRAVRLTGDEEHEVELVLRCSRWGVFDVGRLTVRARDPLRLAAWTASFPCGAVLKAYPSEIALRRIVAPVETQVHAGSEVARVRGDGIEYADIRDFVPGDRVRSINWRASARRQVLVVNERHPERNTDVVLFVDSFLDVKLGGRSVLEEAVRAAASLSTRYLERRDRVGLVGLGGVLRWVQPGMGVGQLYRLVETMLETGVEPTYTWGDVTRIPARILPPKALVLALTPLLDRRFVGALQDLRARRFDVAVVEIDPVPLVPAGPSELDRLAHRLWLLDREVQRSDLQRVGIAVASWRDGSLDGPLEEVRTFRRYARTAHV